MKKIILFSSLLAVTVISACKKDKDDETPIGTSAQQVLTDFANVLANPNYSDIATKAGVLNAAVQTFIADSTDANLAIARNRWREVRQPWEQCEAFIFGPVEDFNYDPMMDTWPVNRVDMDSLLASTNPLTVAEIEGLPESLKGFHPLEYMLFGNGGSKLAADFTVREKLYMVSLAQNLYNITVALKDSWDVNVGNFTTDLVTAGAGSTRYATRKDALIAIVNGMAGICEEVAGGKMEEPLIAQDSTLEESQFAHNSTADFQNNMKGVLNVYLGKFTGDGHGLNELVAAKNLSLDNTLQAQMNSAVDAFNNISSNYGAAIYTQQVQIIAAQDAINNLESTLSNELMNFIIVNVKD